MTRTYDRDAKHYDFAVLTHLVETGQASFFEGPGIFVIKTEDGTVAVRPHQVIFTATPAPFEIKIASPMDGYHGQERFDGEDTGPGGVVYDSLLDLAEKFLGDNLEGTDPLAVVRRMLDDESFEKLVIDEVCGTVPARRRRNGWVSATETDELLSHFSR